jgi:hypothetical protein
MAEFFNSYTSNPSTVKATIEPSTIKATVDSTFNKGNDVKFVFDKLVSDKLVLKSNNCGDISHQIEITFNFHNKNIYINQIYKCGEMTGTETLRKIIEVGKKIMFNSITLGDQSKIRSNTCEDEFDLPIIDILTRDHAESWYNREGFKSTTHEDDMKHNKKQKKLQLVDVLIENVGLKDEIFEKFKEDIEDIENIENIEDVTLGDFFKKIKTEYLKKEDFTELTTEQCETLNKLIQYLKEKKIIRYTRTLIYKLPQYESEIIIEPVIEREEEVTPPNTKNKRKRVNPQKKPRKTGKTRKTGGKNTLRKRK